MSYDFSTTLSAKWILAGEHAVVRQHPAIIYPLPHYQFTLTYQASKSPWQLSTHDSKHTELQSLFFATLEHALSLTHEQSIHKTGSFHISNTIPLGSGLGASAAFCFAISQWLAYRGLIDRNEQYQTAKRLENRFHGQSSGVDIVGISAKTGRYFQAGNHAEVLQTWQPYWYLSSSETSSKTDHCTAYVNDLWQTNASKALSIDKQMTNSVHLALAALQDSEHGLPKLAEAINLAKDCFQQWKLIDSNIQHHADNLISAGALACKPTGSGGGGHVISLWAQPAPKLEWPMIPLQLQSPVTESNEIKKSRLYD